MSHFAGGINAGGQKPGQSDQTDVMTYLFSSTDFEKWTNFASKKPKSLILAEKGGHGVDKKGLKVDKKGLKVDKMTG